MTHFSRRLSEILGARPRRTRAEVARDLAKAALEQTRAGREKRAAMMQMRAGR